MKITPVSSKNTHSAFLEVPKHIYKNDPNWIPPLERDINFIFDPEQNKAFQSGNIKRWLLYDDFNNLIGRIAAFYYQDIIVNDQSPKAGIGYFECIHHQEAANKLFDQAIEWLKSHGVSIIDGPINFGERDKFWGLLVQGFKPPSYLENYNPSYYQELFENYGFKEHFKQESFEIRRENVDIQRMGKIAQRINRKTGYEVEFLDLKYLDHYANYFIEIYNKAWQDFEDFRPLSQEEAKQLILQFKDIMIRDFIPFIIINGKPAGFMAFLPDVNQIFKHVDGKLDLKGKMKFLWYKKFKTINKLKGLVFGVHPDFQNSGIDALLVYHLMRSLEKHPHIEWAELSWIGSFNPKMHSFLKNLNAKVCKVHLTYRLKV